MKTLSFSLTTPARMYGRSIIWKPPHIDGLPDQYAISTLDNTHPTFYGTLDEVLAVLVREHGLDDLDSVFKADLIKNL